MKFFEKRGIALAVLVLAIAAAVFIGQSRKAGYIENQPVTLPEVQYRQWICDEAGMLSDATKDAIRQYNDSWDSRYYAVIAVATVDDVTGWTPEEAAQKLGADWGLAANDIFTVYKKGKTVTNPQTGIKIELPGTKVGTVTVLQSTGDTPETEISLCSYEGEEVNVNDLTDYYISDK